MDSESWVNAMQKNYTKPELIFESFSLMDAIAAACPVRLEGDKTREACHVTDEDLGVIWLMSEATCQAVDSGMGAYMGTVMNSQ